MPNPERRSGKVNLEKARLIEGEPITFTLKSLTPDGLLQERGVSGVLEEEHKGQFHGDVWFLEKRPWVIKTARPTRMKYGVPVRALRSVNEGLRPFLPQHFETAAQMELIGQKILKLLVEGYLGDKYYVPEAIGYTFLSGIGFGQVVEKVDFRSPHRPAEIERIFKAQHELTEFCSEAGLVELSSQIHERNPLAPPNLAFLEEMQMKEKRSICWLDTLPAIKMRESGYIPPVFFFSFHREICQQTKQEESLPAFNRIHVAKTREFIEQEEVREKMMDNIGRGGLDKLGGWLTLYESILESYDRIRALDMAEQWKEAWRASPDISPPVAERVEHSTLLYTLARVFGINTVMYFLDETYRKWVNEGWLLPERRKEKWKRFKRREIAGLRKDLRIGSEQQLESNWDFVANLAASRSIIIRPWMQRLAFDPDFRDIEKLTRYFVLSGAKEARKNNVISAEELERLENEVSLENLGRKKIAVYSVTFLGQQTIARAADFFEIGNYIAAVSNRAPSQAVIGFLGGWVAPVLARFIYLEGIQRISREDLSTTIRWNFLPKLGHYVGVPDQIAVTLGDRRIREFAFRNRVAKVLSLWPTSGWGTKSELQLWRKIGKKLSSQKLCARRDSNP